MHRAEILDRLSAAGSVPLCCLTEEELAAVDAGQPALFQPAEAPARLRELPPSARTAVLATALRGLLARGLLEPPGGPDWTAAGPDGPVELRPRDELAVILGARRAPAALVLVRQQSSAAVLYGFREAGLTGSAPGISGFLEERTGRLGLHHFNVRTTGNAVDTLSTLAGPAGSIRLYACHARPAGSRRIQAHIRVGPGEASVVWSASGVKPEPPRAFAVTAGGLRQVILEALCDPGGDAAGSGRPPSPAAGTATGKDDAMAGSAGPPYQCPVCGYPGLQEPARSEAGHPSWEICPSCGFEFGYDDDDAGRSYADWRQEWIAQGMPWRIRSYRPPPGWDPRAQLQTRPEAGPNEAGR